ncbi:MAG: hypothetical protein ACR2GU_09450 [Rubrobacteraceae bacterium]
MGVQVSHHEPAAVEEDDQGVGTATFGGGVVTRGERPGGAVYRQVSHRSHGSRLTVGYRNLLAVHLARLAR